MIGYSSPPECECVTADAGTEAGATAASGGCEALTACCNNLDSTFAPLQPQCQMAADLGNEDLCNNTLAGYQSYCP